MRRVIFWLLQWLSPFRWLCLVGRHRHATRGKVHEVFGDAAQRKRLGLMPLRGDEHVVVCLRTGCRFVDVWRKR